jgi:hypothetical protein
VDELVYPLTLENASERQILVATYRKLERMESMMTELSQVVEQLKTSVADLVDTLVSRTGPLQQALADAQQKLADFTLADEIEDAGFKSQIEELQTDLQAKIEEAQNAVSEIQGSVQRIEEIRDSIESEAPDTGGEPGGGETGPTAPDTGGEPGEPSPTGPSGPDSGGEEPGATGPSGPTGTDDLGGAEPVNP